MTSPDSWAPPGISPTVRWSEGDEGVLELAVGDVAAEYPVRDSVSARAVYLQLLSLAWQQRAEEGGR